MGKWALGSAFIRHYCQRCFDIEKKRCFFLLDCLAVCTIYHSPLNLFLYDGSCDSALESMTLWIFIGEKCCKKVTAWPSHPLVWCHEICDVMCSSRNSHSSVLERNVKWRKKNAEIRFIDRNTFLFDCFCFCLPILAKFFINISIYIVYLEKAPGIYQFSTKSTRFPFCIASLFHE